MAYTSEKKLRCFDCAYCSESYLTFIDSCGVDDHVISDVFAEHCGRFTPSEETIAEARNTNREECCTARQLT